MSQSSSPLWAVPGYLAEVNGHLNINGADAVDLAREFGTPLYIFSEARIADNINKLKSAAESVWPRVKLCYASKANSTMAVLNVVRNTGIDLEVNSGGELFQALKVGFTGEQIIFNGVAKTEREIEEAINAEIFAINVDSLFELEMIARVSERMKRTANVTIRLVPEIITRSHVGLQTALYKSKFGLSPQEVQQGFDISLASKYVRLRGIHIHVGSQTPDADAYARAFELMWQHMVMLYERTGYQLDHVNLGGGIPVNYLRDDSEADQIGDRERVMLGAKLDLAEILRTALDGVANQLSTDVANAQEILNKLTLLFEPGRSVIGDTGVMLATVHNTKMRPETGDVWLLVDAGYNQLLPMNNYKWYYHAVAAARAGEPHTERYKLAGPLCDGGDVFFDLEQGNRLPDYRLLPTGVKPGDLIAFLNTGAYTLAQLSRYNSRTAPAVVMITRDGQTKIARHAENYDDLIARDLW